MTKEDIERYSRQMMIEGIGEAGQAKLAAAKVLVVGAGGLGSPVMMYLAGAGVGTIGIVDADTVSLSNIHRQLIHAEEKVGQSKLDSAAEGVSRINSGTKINKHHGFLSEENAAEILGGYDIVADCTDNFEARFTINRFCVSTGRPFVHGGILEFAGQVISIFPGETACYACIFGEIPEKTVAERCSRAGVLGPVPGVIGSIQALELIKILSGLGASYAGKMLCADLSEGSFRTIRFRKNPKCRICGDRG